MIQVELSYIGFAKTMFFNRVAVITEAGYKLMHFGFITHHGLLGDMFSAAIADRDLTTLKKPLEDYLEQLGSIEDEIFWDPPYIEQPVVPCNIIGMARLDNSGEVVLHNFSQKAVVDARGKKAAGVSAQAVALLRSDIKSHKHLIRKLYY